MRAWSAILFLAQLLSWMLHTFKKRNIQNTHSCMLVWYYSTYRVPSLLHGMLYDQVWIYLTLAMMELILKRWHNILYFCCGRFRSRICRRWPSWQTMRRLWQVRETIWYVLNNTRWIRFVCTAFVLTRPRSKWRQRTQQEKKRQQSTLRWRRWRQRWRTMTTNIQWKMTRRARMSDDDKNKWRQDQATARTSDCVQ